MRISDWSSDVCSSDLLARPAGAVLARGAVGRAFVAGVAAPAVAAAQKDEPFALFRQVGEQAAILVVGEDLGPDRHLDDQRSEEHTSELQSLMRISYAVFCLKNKK